MAHVICAWCATILQRDVMGLEHDSHGICTDCEATLLLETVAPQAPERASIIAARRALKDAEEYLAKAEQALDPHGSTYTTDTQLRTRAAALYMRQARTFAQLADSYTVRGLDYATQAEAFRERDRRRQIARGDSAATVEGSATVRGSTRDDAPA